MEQQKIRELLSRHVKGHGKVLVLGATAELRNIANNPDAIRWVDKHVEALSAAIEKPDWHTSYKLWAKDEKVDAIEAFMVSVQGGN